MKTLVLSLAVFFAATSVCPATTITGSDLSNVTGVSGLVVDSNVYDVSFVNVTSPFGSATSEQFAEDESRLDTLFTANNVLGIKDDISASPGNYEQSFVVPTSVSEWSGGLFDQITGPQPPTTWIFSQGGISTPEQSFTIAIFTAVPEPSAVVLFGLGCLGLLFAACRRRKAA